MRLNNQKGFTLTELMVSMTLMLISLAAFYSVFVVQTRSLKAQDYRLEAQQYARAVLDLMIREIRSTGYFPGSECATPGHTLGIVAADEETLQIVYDADGDNACTSANENITYSYDFPNKNITRAADGGAAEVLTDGNATAFQFVYYPRQNTAVVPPPFCVTAGYPSGCSGDLAANLANIQRVEIRLTVESKILYPGAASQLIATLSSSVDLRNRS